MVVVIINPVSGGARPEAARRRAELAMDVMGARGEAGEVFVTERRGHARELAAAAVANRARLVIAWGGDGTVNEVASALTFGPVPLGLVPSGSGNGLARELDISGRPDRALAGALAGAARPIDVGEIGGRLFVSVAGMGFDAHVAACFDREGGRRGLVGYARISVRELVRYRSPDYRIDGGAHQARRALLVTVANSAQFGNGARIAPGARVDDGRLDLVVFEERSRFATLCALPRLFTGGVARVRGVSIRQIERATIEADAPMVFHVDGEPVAGGARLDVRIHPASLNVVRVDDGR